MVLVHPTGAYSADNASYLHWEICKLCTPYVHPVYFFLCLLPTPSQKLRPHLRWHGNLFTCAAIYDLVKSHSADAVWRGIPRSLESLTLLRFMNGLTNCWDRHCIATRIVRHVSTCGARLPWTSYFRQLWTTVDLIDTIVRHFPALQTLHVGMDVWPVAQDRISISVCWYVIRIIFLVVITIRQEEYVQLYSRFGSARLYLGSFYQSRHMCMHCISLLSSTAIFGGGGHTAGGCFCLLSPSENRWWLRMSPETEWLVSWYLRACCHSRCFSS